MAVQLDSNTSAGPIVASDTAGGDTHYPVGKVAFGAIGAATRVDTSNPLPVNIFGSDSAHGAFIFNNAATPIFLAGDTAGTPIDDTNPLPVTIISGADANDTTVTATISGTPTVDLGANNDVINTAATPFFVAGDTAGTPVDDTNAFPVAIISGNDTVVTVTNIAANDTVVTVTNMADSTVTVSSGTVTVGNDSSDPVGVVNAPGDPLHIASDTAATPVSAANPLPVTIRPSTDTANGLTIFRDATNDTAVALVSGTPVTLYGYKLFNPDTAAAVYIHFYNDTAVTMGTDSDVMVFGIPPLGGANEEFANGIPFGVGLSIASTAAATSTDAAAAPTATVVNLLYK